MSDQIELYLDQVIAEMRGRVPRSYRVVAEIEAHLRDTEADLVAGGLDPHHAQQEAIARFGPPKRVVAGYVESPLPLLRELVRVAWMLVGVGLVLVGASGLVTAGMHATFGAEFVAGTAAHHSLSDEQCRAVAPDHVAGETCARSAAVHASTRVIWVRILIGIAGLAITEANVLGRASRTRATRLPGEVLHALSTAGLAALAVVAGVLASNRIGFHDAVGAGQWVSLSLVFVVGAAIAGRRLWSVMHVDARAT